MGPPFLRLLDPPESIPPEYAQRPRQPASALEGRGRTAHVLLEGLPQSPCGGVAEAEGNVLHRSVRPLQEMAGLNQPPPEEEGPGGSQPHSPKPPQECPWLEAQCSGQIRYLGSGFGTLDGPPKGFLGKGRKVLGYSLNDDLCQASRQGLVHQREDLSGGRVLLQPDDTVHTDPSEMIQVHLSAGEVPGHQEGE